MLRRSIDPYDSFGTLMQEIMSPMKYNRVLENVGTKDEPTIVTRGEWVEKNTGHGVKRMALTMKNLLKRGNDG